MINQVIRPTHTHTHLRSHTLLCCPLPCGTKWRRECVCVLTDAVPVRERWEWGQTEEDVRTWPATTLCVCVITFRCEREHRLAWGVRSQPPAPFPATVSRKDPPTYNPTAYKQQSRCRPAHICSNKCTQADKGCTTDTNRGKRFISPTGSVTFTPPLLSLFWPSLSFRVCP